MHHRAGGEGGLDGSRSLHIPRLHRTRNETAKAGRLDAPHQAILDPLDPPDALATRQTNMVPRRQAQRCGRQREACSLALACFPVEKIGGEPPGLPLRENDRQFDMDLLRPSASPSAASATAD